MRDNLYHFPKGNRLIFGMQVAKAGKAWRSHESKDGNLKVFSAEAFESTTLLPIN